MIEVVFGASAHGSLRAAQHYGKGKYRGGGFCVLFSSTDGTKPSRKEIEDAQREVEERDRVE